MDAQQKACLDEFGCTNLFQYAARRLHSLSALSFWSGAILGRTSSFLLSGKTFPLLPVTSSGIQLVTQSPFVLRTPMVYRGKPSPACEPCRARRSKVCGLLITSVHILD
jgi:hypothetical protein